MPSQAALPNRRRLMKYWQLLRDTHTHGQQISIQYIPKSPCKECKMYASTCTTDAHTYAVQKVGNGAYLHTHSLLTTATHKLIISCYEPLTWQIQYVHMQAVGCVYSRRYELGICAVRLCQQVKYYCSCLLLCRQKAAANTHGMMHRVCAQLKEQDLTANKAQRLQKETTRTELYRQPQWSLCLSEYLPIYISALSIHLYLFLWYSSVAKYFSLFSPLLGSNSGSVGWCCVCYLLFSFALSMSPVIQNQNPTP